MWRLTMAALATVVQPFPAHAEQSALPLWGLSVETSSSIVVCSKGRPLPYEYSIWALIDPKDAEHCSRPSGVRSIVFRADLADETNASTPALARQICAEAAREEGRCTAPPAGLKLNDRPSLTVKQINRRSRWIDIWVVAHASRYPPAGIWRGFNYTMRLHTDRAHLSQDQALFAAVLPGVRISPPKDHGCPACVDDAAPAPADERK
jgi:hypothetical protein